MVTKKIPATREDFKELFNEFGIKLKNELKTELKDELLKEMVKLKDEIMGEIKTMREEQTIQSGDHARILDLEDAVENLQTIHPHNQHASV